MALVLVDVTGALTAGQVLLSHFTAGDLKNYESTAVIAASNIANYLGQVVVHDTPPTPVPVPAPVLSVPPEHVDFFKSLLAPAQAAHAAEPVGSVLSVTIAFFIAQLQAWFKKQGW